VLKDAFGFPAMALAVAALALAGRYVGIAGVWRRARESRVPATIPFRDAIRATFANRSFLLFLPSFVLFQIGFLMLIGLIPFYVDAILPAGSWVGVRVLTAVAIAAAVVAVPAFALLARRTSKRAAYRVGMLGAALAFPLVAFAGLLPRIPVEVQALGGHYLFPAPLTADIIDDDCGRTGFRREATYFGTQHFVEKTASSLAPLFLVLLLLLGDSRGQSLGVRLVGPAAGAMVLVGYFVFRAYALADDVAAEPYAIAPRSASATRS
jgi:GPH family glycoside/pentoside/hexuronide:cation symporter